MNSLESKKGYFSIWTNIKNLARLYFFLKEDDIGDIHISKGRFINFDDEHTFDTRIASSDVIFCTELNIPTVRKILVILGIEFNEYITPVVHSRQASLYVKIQYLIPEYKLRLAMIS